MSIHQNMSGVWACKTVIALLIAAVRAAGRREAIVARVVGKEKAGPGAAKSKKERGGSRNG